MGAQDDIERKVKGEKAARWPTVTTNLSPEMKAHLMDALHKEGWTLSISEYIRVIVARHVAKVLDLSVAEVIYKQPDRGSKAGTKYMRVS